MRRTARRRVSYIIKHDQDDHGHLLGVNSLVLDTTSIQPNSGRPEGILYTAGRDGVIASWDLNLPFKERTPQGSTVNGYEANKLNNNVEFDSNEESDEDVPLAKKLSEFKGNWEIEDDFPSTQPPPISTFRQSFQSHTDWVNDIVLCHNNETLVSASSDRTLKLWHPHKTNSPINIGSHSDYIKALAYAPGPGWVASGGFDRKISIWDINECRPISNESNFTGLTQSDDKPIATMSEASPKTSIYALACNPSGTVLVSGSPEKIIRVWDPRTSKCVMKFTGHTDNIRAILVSDDGELILSGSSDTTIKLWSLAAQRCINTFTIHSDSVWTLFSDHPRLETFYAGSKDGLLTKTDYSGYAEIRDGECVAICKENAGIVKVVALDNKYIWTATSSSNINRWLDIPNRLRRKTIAQASSSPPISPVLPSSPAIPSTALIKLTSTGTSYGTVSIDSEIATLYSLAIEDRTYDDEGDDPVPIRDVPDFVIPGQHGLIKHCILNNRRHILTVDTSGEVALWDIIKCIRVKTFGKRDLEDVCQEINTIESIPNWCSVDTRIGALTIQLDESRCFDAEMYADEAEEESNAHEEQRINLGKWVLRYLFANFIQAEMKAHEESKSQLSSQSRPHLADDPSSMLQRRESQENVASSEYISFPPATVHTAQFGEVANTTASANEPTLASALNMNAVGPTIPAAAAKPTSAMNDTSPTTPQSPTTPLAAFTGGPYTTPPATGTGQPDYFSGSHHSSANDPTGPTPSGTTVTDKMGSASTVIQPPPPALVSQGSNNNGTSSSMFGRLKHSFSSNVRKLSRSPSAETKIDNAESLNTGNYPNSRIIQDSKFNATVQASDDLSKTSTEEAAKINSPTSETSQATRLPGLDTSLNQSLTSQSADYQTNSTVQASPFGHLNLQETPEIHIPQHTTIIISEESPEASTSVDLYRGTIASLGMDSEEIRHKAPGWLVEFLTKNKVLQKELVRISFVLRPHEGSELGELPNGNTRLSANRMLRARKILVYVVDKLELDQPSSTRTLDFSDCSSSEERENEMDLEQEREEERKRTNALKPEMWLELLCNDQIIPPSMTLATIKSHLWKSGGDHIVMTYRLRMKSV